MTDNQDERAELVSQAKELGIAQAFNMKVETLKKRINEKLNPKNQVEIVIDEGSLDKFNKLGLKIETLKSIINQYGLSKLEYIAKFNAFRCYKDGEHVDWFDLNDVSKYDGGRNVFDILLKFQKVTKRKEKPNRGLIDFMWRV